jgi:hypothetical protein
MAVYVCIQCADDTRSGCTFTTKRELLPMMCAPDPQGYAKICRWDEVPDRKQTKIGFPEYLART